jgi:hypothetical protein
MTPILTHLIALQIGAAIGVLVMCVASLANVDHKGWK